MFPSGAKALVFPALDGTAEAVPFPKPIYEKQLYEARYGKPAK
jgi:hypothetical protein